MGGQKMCSNIREKDYFSVSYAITRVLNTGVIMSCLLYTSDAADD